MKIVHAALSTALLAFGSAGFAADTKPAPDTNQRADQQRLEDAHKRLEQAAREVAELSSKQARVHVPDNFVFLGRNPNRAVLGIAIGNEKETEVDDGVAVLSVTPEGPASKAGLKGGDVIVELNGKSLKRDKDDSPSEKLLDAMGKLSPGDEVTLRYQREGKSSIVKVKADRLEQGIVRKEMRIRGLPGEPGERFRFDHDDFDFDFPHNFAGIMHGGSAFGDVELVPLTPKLAQYFGAEKGLLVVRAPEGKDLKLEDGDVLIDIDGRVPSNSGHAFRILGSYQAGEKVTLNVLRQKKKTALAITVPEREDRGAHPPRPPRPPKPASAPRPPTAPSVPPV